MFGKVVFRSGGGRRELWWVLDVEDQYILVSILLDKKKTMRTHRDAPCMLNCSRLPNNYANDLLQPFSIAYQQLTPTGSTIPATNINLTTSPTLRLKW